MATVFDPETIELMRSVLDEAWTSLPPDQRATMSQTLLAEHILAAAKSHPRLFRVETMPVIPIALALRPTSAGRTPMHPAPRACPSWWVFLLLLIKTSEREAMTG